jgi:hypothetical protein
LHIILIVLVLVFVLILLFVSVFVLLALFSNRLWLLRFGPFKKRQLGINLILKEKQGTDASSTVTATQKRGEKKNRHERKERETRRSTTSESSGSDVLWRFAGRCSSESSDDGEPRFLDWSWKDMANLKNGEKSVFRAFLLVLSWFLTPTVSKLSDFPNPSDSCFGFHSSFFFLAMSSPSNNNNRKRSLSPSSDQERPTKRQRTSDSAEEEETAEEKIVDESLPVLEAAGPSQQAQSPQIQAPLPLPYRSFPRGSRSSSSFSRSAPRGS